MSGSDKPQSFPVDKKDDSEGISKHESSSQPMSANLESSPETLSETERKRKEEEEEETDKATVVSYTESENQIAEDDDGFKTPTSSDHRIPAIMQCPPAPKKPRPQPSKLKRKASPPPGVCRSLQLDSSTDVESIFRLINPNDQDDTQDQKFKKSRTDDHKDQS